ncbi:hypothetical protein ACQFYA_21265 [Promicromonospora sp. Marseille-Q5078]
MTDIDLSHLPTGARGWAALVAWVTTSDDRLERYFLELKSDVDLTTKRGRHKVAKFILGAANRDPAKADFGGHAVLLLGVGNGTATGIGPFEAQDLEREVQKFTGANGPGWDYEHIPVNSGRDVIAIVVDPPTGRIWPCLADGEGMTNGDIYLRGDGKTEKATGAEVQAMFTRAGTTTTASLPDIAVEFLGEALAIRVDRDRITRWVEDTAQDYLDDMDPPAPSSGFPLAGLAAPAIVERRSKGEFRREVQRWRESALSDPTTGVYQIAARQAVGLRLRVKNPVKRPLRDVRIDVELDDPARALDWEAPDEDKPLTLFPGRPVDWGRDSFASIISAGIGDRFLPVRDRHGILRVTQTSPAKLSLSLDLLHAEETFLSDEDEVVLVAYVDAETDQPITGRWRLTAGDVHDVLNGTLSIPVDYRDWTKAIAHLAGDAPPDS